MEIKSYQIEVRDSIFNPFQANTEQAHAVHYVKRLWKQEDCYWYQVWLSLVGNDVIFVKRATYTLHPTLPNPVRVIERRPDNPNCILDIWTWGAFNVQVEIEDISGRILTLSHYLNYNEEIKKQENNREVKWIAAAN